VSRLGYATNPLIKIDETKCIPCQIYAAGNNVSDADETWQYYGCPGHTCGEKK